MDRKLALKTIKRLDEIGAFDMQLVRELFQSKSDKERTIEALEYLMSIDLYDIPHEKIRKYIVMDDEKFERNKWKAQLLIKGLDFKETGSLKSIIGF